MSDVASLLGLVTLASSAGVYTWHTRRVGRVQREAHELSNEWNAVFTQPPENVRPFGKTEGGSKLVLGLAGAATYDGKERREFLNHLVRSYLGPSWELSRIDYSNRLATFVKSPPKPTSQRHTMTALATRAAHPTEPPPAFDTTRAKGLQRRLDTVMDHWLDYDRDVELLLRRPGMRNYSLPATNRCARLLLDADRRCRQMSTSTDLDALESLMNDVELAFDEAVLAADVQVQQRMSKKEHDLLTRAQNALALALGGATEPERLSAYRVVSRVMQQLGAPLSKESHTAIRALIEPRRLPIGELTSHLIVRTPEVIFDGLPDHGDERRVYLDTRVRRAGAHDVDVLTHLLQQTLRDVHSNDRDGVTHDRDMIHALVGSLEDNYRVVQALSSCDDREVAYAARERVTELSEALTNARNALTALERTPS